MSENDIVQLSKDFIAAQVSDLSGNEDPKAFQIVRSEDDILGVSLVDIPCSDDEKDLMADYLAAACCLHRAVESTFASSAWSSMYSNPIDASKIMPMERSNRVEIVMLVHVTSETIQTHTAAILRVNGEVRLSPWLVESDRYCNSGRIPEALRMGIRLSKDMPQELVDALKQAREDLPPGRILELFVNQIRQVRDEARKAAEKN
jgi:hypothetical protein